MIRSQTRTALQYALFCLSLVWAFSAASAPPDQGAQRSGKTIQPTGPRLEQRARKPARRQVQKPLSRDALEAVGSKPDLQANYSAGATHSIGQPGTYAVRLTSTSQPTAYRMANSIRELQSATWKPFESNPVFTINGQFPAQIVAQVGKPLGYASHPVNGPHRESDAVVVSHGSMKYHTPEPIVRVWHTEYEGNYTGVTGTLSVALSGLGADTNNIAVSELTMCSNHFKPTQAPSVVKEAPGTFVLSVRGMFSYAVSQCRVIATIVGDGGNFDNAKAYQYDRINENFSIASKPSLSVTNTGDFAYRPKFTLTDAGPGNCTKGTDSNGRYYFEVTSGALPGSCTFTAPELLVPPAMTMQGLHWQVQEFRAGNNKKFHCSVRSNYPDGETRFWYQMVSPERWNYFHETTTANPLLPGSVTPEVTADLSYPARRQWIPPLRARISCGVFIGQNSQGNFAYDRLRLVLDRVDFRAPPGLPIGTTAQPQ